MSSKAAKGKTAAPRDEAESGSSPVHRMRITSGGSIQAYVAFALKHLENNPGSPLVLHTIPSPSSSDQPPPKDPRQAADEADPAPTTRAEAEGSKGRSKALTTLHPCTLTTPRLISVVELIKRDYLVGLAASGKGKGKHRATGLWQYTETGLLPDAPTRDASGEHGDDEARGEALKRVLEGRTKPKMTHRPYLQITLSTRPLGLEAQKNVTCQYVLARRNRKGRKAELSNGAEAGDVNKDQIKAQVSESGEPAGPGQVLERKSKGKKRKAAQDGQSPNRAKRKREGERPVKDAS